VEEEVGEEAEELHGRPPSTARRWGSGVATGDSDSGMPGVLHARLVAAEGRAGDRAAVRLRRRVLCRAGS
jgi:hypothetical protein